MGPLASVSIGNTPYLSGEGAMCIPMRHRYYLLIFFVIFNRTEERICNKVGVWSSRVRTSFTCKCAPCRAIAESYLRWLNTYAFLRPPYSGE